VPAHVAAGVIGAATWASGKKAGTVSPGAAVIAEGVLRSMLLTRVQVAILVLVLLAMVGGAIAWMCGTLTALPAGLQANSGDQTKRKQATPANTTESSATDAGPEQAGREKPTVSHEQKLAFAVENMKRNLDGIKQFVCRYTITDCQAPTLQDAVSDRNVDRGKIAWHALWIVKKPAERFLVVTAKALLDQPVGHLIAPKVKAIGTIQGATQTQNYIPKVFSNCLSDGSFNLCVGESLPVSVVKRGFASRQPGTPLEGESFQYTEPDALLKNANGRRVSFTGLSPEGLWQFS
jgi:hypothetical protein